MNIVKEFEDREFLEIMYNWHDSEYLKKYFWYWGLGDDGELYCRCNHFKNDDWIKPGDSRGNFGELINLRTMKRIVKHFGHLVVFT